LDEEASYTYERTVVRRYVHTITVREEEEENESDRKAPHILRFPLRSLLARRGAGRAAPSERGRFRCAERNDILRLLALGAPDAVGARRFAAHPRKVCERVIWGEAPLLVGWSSGPAAGDAASVRAAGVTSSLTSPLDEETLASWRGSFGGVELLGPEHITVT